jgi:hypothetical protein
MLTSSPRQEPRRRSRCACGAGLQSCYRAELKFCSTWGLLEDRVKKLRKALGDTRSSLLEVIDSSSRATQKLYDEGRKETRELLTDLRKDVVQTLGTEMRVLHEDLVERIEVLGKA